MTLETIYQFFQEHHPNYLNEKLAVCYIASLLLKGDTYGTEIIQSLERNYPIYRLSDTVLYSALKFLETEQLITGYRKHATGRGRPRHMFQLTDHAYDRAAELAQLWQSYTSDSHSTVSPSSDKADYYVKSELVNASNQSKGLA